MILRRQGMEDSQMSQRPDYSSRQPLSGIRDVLGICQALRQPLHAIEPGIGQRLVPPQATVLTDVA